MSGACQRLVALARRSPGVPGCVQVHPGGASAATATRRRRCSARTRPFAGESLGMALAPIAPPSFEHQVLDFLAYLEFERGLSRNTLEAYRSDLLQFGRFLDERELQAIAARGADIADFLAALAGSRGRSASPATIHRKTACLRSFYRHLRREGVLDTDPTASVTAPRRGRKLPQVLTRGQVNKLLAQPKGTEPTRLRRISYAVFCLK